MRCSCDHCTDCQVVAVVKEVGSTSRLALEVLRNGGSRRGQREEGQGQESHSVERWRLGMQAMRDLALCFEDGLLPMRQGQSRGGGSRWQQTSSTDPGGQGVGEDEKGDGQGVWTWHPGGRGTQAVEERSRSRDPRAEGTAEAGGGRHPSVSLSRERPAVMAPPVDLTHVKSRPSTTPPHLRRQREAGRQGKSEGRTRRRRKRLRSAGAADSGRKTVPGRSSDREADADAGRRRRRQQLQRRRRGMRSRRQPRERFSAPMQSSTGCWCNVTCRMGMSWNWQGACSSWSRPGTWICRHT